MSTPDLTPIPTPPAQRLRQFKTTTLPLVVFLGAVGVIALLWRDHIGATTMVGQADGLLSNVSSHQAGVLAGMRVVRFQKVHVGEPLASVLIADPKLVEASLAVIRAELDVLRANLQPLVAQQRNAVNYAQLRLNWMRERTDLASARVNMQYAESELRRTEELFSNKIASASALDLARANFQALQKQVEELDRLVAEGQQSFRDLQPTNSADLSRISDEPMRAAIAAQEAKLRLTEAQLSPVNLCASIDGTVTAVFYRSGESVTPGQPIMTIAADAPERIVGYLRQPTGVEPKPGDKVLVRTRGIKRFVGTAQIMGLGRRFEPVPLALQSSLKLAALDQARPVNISVPTGLQLHPGELVDLQIVSATE